MGRLAPSPPAAYPRESNAELSDVTDRRADNEIFHLVFLRASPVLLVRRPDADSLALQNEFSDYMTSLGPMTPDDATEWLSVEYGADEKRAAAIGVFAAAGGSEMEV
jgi:hypothetical protein